MPETPLDISFASQYRGIQNLKPEIQNTKIQNVKSQMQNPKSKARNPKSKFNNFTKKCLLSLI